MYKKLVLLHALAISKKGDMDQWTLKTKILVMGLGAIVVAISAALVVQGNAVEAWIKNPVAE